ncbi:MAG TPA: RDD family protein [Planctomycetota bacterium]|nr:RDD family protein [Planctomycetota bacterium]
MNTPPRPSAFYERKRRLAYYFAWASMAFLFLELTVGFLLEFISRPRAAAAADGYRLIHRAFNQDDPDGSRLYVLDPDAKPLAPPLSFPDTATALLPEGGDLTVFFGAHAARLVDGKITRSGDLNQKWEVLCALADPAGPWVFGWQDNSIIARRRDKEVWSSEIVVAKAGAVDQIVSSREGAAGPLVAWRERGTGTVRSALFNGTAFEPQSAYDIGAAEHWDLVLTGGRHLLIVYNREDRTYRYVTLRLGCCPGCASPLLPRKIRFTEPVFLLGRRVTGLSAAVWGDRLRVFITRISTLMTASLPLATLEPEPATSRLQSIGSPAPWRHIAAAFAPLLLIFCSLSMIFLGFILFRERARMARGTPVAGLQFADFLPRAMALALDLLLLTPFLVILVEILNVAPDGGLPDLEDPRFIQVGYVIIAVQFLYYFLMEWRLGGTVGKKIIGLKVTELDGSRLRLRGALVRNVIRLFDVLNPFGALLGTAALLLTKRHQRLGDLAGRTLVLQDRPD